MLLGAEFLFPPVASSLRKWKRWRLRWAWPPRFCNLLRLAGYRRYGETLYTTFERHARALTQIISQVWRTEEVYKLANTVPYVIGMYAQCPFRQWRIIRILKTFLTRLRDVPNPIKTALGNFSDRQWSTIRVYRLPDAIGQQPQIQEGFTLWVWVYSTYKWLMTSKNFQRLPETSEDF